MELTPPRRHLEQTLGDAGIEFQRRLASGEVATTRCEGCGVTAFPPRERCPRCGGVQEWVELPRRGRLHAFTTQERAVRFTDPAVLALVELGDTVLPAVVEGTPYGSLAIGQEVEVEPRPEPQTGFHVLHAHPAGGT